MNCMVGVKRVNRRLRCSDGGVYKRHPTITSPTSDNLSDNTSMGRSIKPSTAKKVELTFQMNTALYQKSSDHYQNNQYGDGSNPKTPLVEPTTGPQAMTQKLKEFGNKFFKPSSTADDTSDSISIRSDASSDSENYVAFNLDKGPDAADTMFSLGGGAGGVELADDALEDDEATLTTPSETSHSIASSYKRRDLVSVATLKLGQVELVQQSEGFQSSVKLQIINVAADECSSIPWDEFQAMKVPLTSLSGTTGTAWLLDLIV
ncbi:identical protein binding [Homalodisca vitripennis]|nr:identical protein binding [Homalodisca vitripennis]